VFTIGFNIYALYTILIYKKKWKKYLLSNKSNKNRFKDVIYINYFNDTIVGFKMLVAVIMMFVLAYLPYKLTTVPALCVYIIYVLHKSDKVKLYDFTITSIYFIIFAFTIIATLNSSYNKRFEKDDYVISFYENSLFITTDRKISTYNYLGESSSHIFLYDLKNKESKIYIKENISDLKIRNTNKIDTYILNIKNNLFVKSFIEMINEQMNNK
jgi:hypothetical protein